MITRGLLFVTPLFSLYPDYCNIGIYSVFTCFLLHKSDVYNEVQPSTFICGFTLEISAINAESKNECSVNVEYEW